MSKHVDAEKGMYFDIPEKDLTTNQIIRAIQFDELVIPWVEENIGNFNEDWTVIQDKQYNSLRIIFRDPQDEVYFSLTWCNNEAK